MLKRKKFLSSFLIVTFFMSLFMNISLVSYAAATNIALNKVATASSGTAAMAFDGNTGTRWESTQGHDPEWLTVDLGSSNIVTGVKLNWETAAAKDYKIQVSINNTNWNDVYTKTGGTGGIENINFATPITGRYVRMYGTARTTQYGYSLWEFEVYGTPVTDNLTTPLITPATGTYTAAQSVTIVDGAPGATIRYTTDNSIPTTTSGTVYSGAFTVSATTTIKAIAYNSDGATSNVATETITINIPPPNIALNKTSTASTNNGANTSDKAFDSSSTTRWESTFSDPQWICVDLGSRYIISGVQLNWEGAAGKNYKIQVSKDNATWTDAYTVTNGNVVGVINEPFATAIDGRFVRMYGTTRLTGYGYSLWDFQVYGIPTTNMVQAPVITSVNGSDTTSQTVTISDGTPGATIIYTTDGTYPTATNGITYTAPFVITDTTKLEAVAYYSGMNESNLATSTITILKPPTGLVVNSSTSNTVKLGWTAVAGAGASYNLYRSTSSNGTYTKVNTSAITANSYTDISLTSNTTYYYEVSAVINSLETGLSPAVSITTAKVSAVDLGPNVFIFDPSMPADAIQGTCNTLFSQQESNQFGNQRYALLFKPGTYNANIRVGFYTQVAGLGQMPDDVNVSGGIGVDAGWMAGNATCNFWRSCENLAITPSTGETKWAVSQAAPLRRVHIKGNLSLFDGGWSSGGYLADSIVDGNVTPGSQQQWLSRNSQWNSWNGGVWNMVFVGNTNPPSGTWPAQPFTTVEKTPVVREKPFLTIDGSGNYSVFVPALENNTKGATWANEAAAGQSISIDKFYIAHPDTDTAASINTALDQGKNLLFTPGIYHISDTIQVKNANTVVLGLGYATLIPDKGVVALTTSDVDGVTIAGLVIDAGTDNSPVLMEVGSAGNTQDHSANPTLLSDVFFRVGGATVGQADLCLKINSNNIIGDDFWIWRADHGAGADWNVNKAANGMIVNGNNVTLYALMVEHFQKYQTLWNGNGGRTYFYQSEMPYDIPSQASWMDGNVNGYASYKVADSVTSHEAWGLGMYSYFRDAVVKLNSAIEAPINPGVIFHDACTVFLSGNGEITHVINNTGKAAVSGDIRQIVINTAPPVITLNGNSIENVQVGAPYQDAGAKASDAKGGDITSNIVTTVTNSANGSVTFNSSVPGTYIYHYNVVDAAGNPAAEVTRTVVVNVPAPITFTLNYIAGANGTISGSTSQTVNNGASGTPVTAVPDVGYHFVKWSDGLTTAERTDSNVSGNISVTANFEINAPVAYTLTVLGGKGSGVYNASSTATVSVITDGKYFDGWMDESGNILSYNKTYSFIITRNMTLKPVLSLNKVILLPAVTIDNNVLYDTKHTDYVQMYILGTFIVPTGYEMVENGFVSVKNTDDNPGTALTLQTSGANVVKVTAMNQAGQVYRVIKTTYGAKFYIRGYITYKNISTGEIVTVYSSDVVKGLCIK